ncbi:MAG TPA: RluA family pseudouridine synthase [Verrucomicrobiae bacterium]|jgi:23S rRNA pseudouridine1911/1915/1917 synthase|nr:RluA family pseudouridine synthase [Verrucomicrobiae bacterium]
MSESPSPPEKESSLVVESSFPRQRLDAYLRDRLQGVSRGTVQRLLEEGHIKVDGRTVKPTHQPSAGETISIRWPEARPAEAQPEIIPLDVLFEDADLLVVNKPPGLVVHPAPGHAEHTLVNALLAHCAGRLSGIGGVARPGIVHRLDKDTSGCVVVAKNDAAHLALSAQFAGRSVEKYYQAIVCGAPPREAGEIEAALARHPRQRKRMAVTARGRPARTGYRLLQRLREAALLELRLHTGRTHQIRVHLQHLGCPVAGDEIYGKRLSKRLAETTGYAAPRQLLHAARLIFDHPISHARLAFEAPRPTDFTVALQKLAL